MCGNLGGGWKNTTGVVWKPHFEFKKMLNPHRSNMGSGHRYGFQGQEQDNETKGNGNSLNFKYRVHDPRLGRFFATDPLESDYPWNSPYAFSENRVMDGVELEGLEWEPIHNDQGEIIDYTYVGYDEVGGDNPEEPWGITLVPKAGSVSEPILKKHEEYHLGGSLSFSLEYAKFYYDDGTSTEWGARMADKLEYVANTFNSTDLISQYSVNKGSAKSKYTEGYLNLCEYYCNGGSIVKESWKARSGPWGNSSAPNWDYKITKIVNTSEKGMVLNGVGFKAYMTNPEAFGRTQLRIHPDQGQNGTAGCIGLDCSANDLNEFRKTIKALLKLNEDIDLMINNSNNPNYNNDGTSTFSGGE